MVWAIIKSFTTKCVQMDPQQLLKTSQFYSICNKCDMQKTAEGVGTTPPSLGSLKVKTLLFDNSYPDLSASPGCIPFSLSQFQTPSTVIRPMCLTVCQYDSLDQTRCQSILFWISACE